MSRLTLDEQVQIMEKQIHAPESKLTLDEKMQYLIEFFGPDPDFTQEASDIVRSNICKNPRREVRPLCGHNEMVTSGFVSHVWKCANCGHVFGLELTQ